MKGWSFSPVSFTAHLPHPPTPVLYLHRGRPRNPGVPWGFAREHPCENRSELGNWDDFAGGQTLEHREQ